MTDILNEASNLVPIVFAVPLIYFVIGLRLSWRGTIACVVLTYAAVVLASQYANRFARSSLISGGIFQPESAVQANALAFGLLLLAALLGLTIAYQVMWGPGGNADSEGGSRLLRSLVAGTAGWGVGALLLLSVVAFYSQEPAFSVLVDSGGALGRAAEVTSRTVLALVTPWLATGLPLFMGG